jgi:6-pyruvoyltetrahydropterin/6-carboxytetrahydropterin synthase
MYKIKVEGNFSSAHNLRGYKGKCESLHGHNWKIEASVASDKVDDVGMVMDFTELKRDLFKILEKLDHKYLNSLTPFKKINPTSENIACYIYTELKKNIPATSSVTVWENVFSSATYEE